jgi:DNA (cytosine-5)-methyltransferase 1
VVTPGIVDGERLQGFDSDWTAPATDAPGVRSGHRWKLVGNAVNVRMAAWVGARLAAPLGSIPEDQRLPPGAPWPSAAWGRGGVAHRVPVSTWPVHEPYEDLGNFLADSRLLSARATAGFLRRTGMGSLRFPPGFLADMESHLDRMGGWAA